MSLAVPTLAVAWEPLTPRGVAAFARASLARLLIIQIVMASIAGMAVMWFLSTDWFPVVTAAVRNLPPTGQISSEQLYWPDEASVQLGANHFLGLAVDLSHSGKLGRVSQFQIEFGRRDLRCYSLLGYWPVDYPAGLRVAFNRPALDPWWGAWEPMILIAAGLLASIGLMITWAVLATLYFLPLRLVVYLEDRSLRLGECWKMSAAALMPGAIFMIIALVCYSLNLVDLVRLGGLVAVHFLIGIIYLLVCPLFLPAISRSAGASANPFASSPGKVAEEPEKPDEAAGEESTSSKNQPPPAESGT